MGFGMFVSYYDIFRYYYEGVFWVGEFVTYAYIYICHK